MTTSALVFEHVNDLLRKLRGRVVAPPNCLGTGLLALRGQRWVSSFLGVAIFFSSGTARAVACTQPDPNGFRKIPQGNFWIEETEINWHMTLVFSLALEVSPCASSVSMTSCFCSATLSGGGLHVLACNVGLAIAYLFVRVSGTNIHGHASSCPARPTGGAPSSAVESSSLSGSSQRETPGDESRMMAGRLPKHHNLWPWDT